VKDLAASMPLYAQLFGVAPIMDEPYYVRFNIDGQDVGLDPNGHSKGMTGPVGYWRQTHCDGQRPRRQHHRTSSDAGRHSLCVWTAWAKTEKTIHLLQWRGPMTQDRRFRGRVSVMARGLGIGIASLSMAVALIPLSAPPIYAEALDQSCTSAALPASVIAGRAGTMRTLAETFTPTVATLAAFDVLYSNPNGSAPVLIGELREGGPSGTLLTSVRARALKSWVGPLWVRFTLPAVQTVTPGQTYAFVLSSLPAGVYSTPTAPFWMRCSAGYSGGTGYSSLRGVYTDANADFGFRVVSAAPRSVSIGDASMLEGNAQSSVLSFPVTLSEASTSPVTVSYTITGTTATGASASGPDVDFNDHGGATGSVTFTPGVFSGKTPTLQQVSVAVFGDTVEEADETFAVTLSSPTGGYELGRGAATGTILNDDGSSSGPVVGVGDAMVVKARIGAQRLSLPVTLSQRVPGGVTVGYTMAAATARWSKTAAAGGEFGGTISGSIRFTALQTARTIIVPIWPDANPGAEVKTLTVTLVSATGTGVSILRATATGTILPVSTGPNLPHSAVGVAVQLGEPCTFTDPINRSLAGSEIIVTWNAPTSGDAPTGYVVTLDATVPNRPVHTDTLPPIPASSTSTGPLCYPVGTRIVTHVAPYNDAGATTPIGPATGITWVPPTGLDWAGSSSISESVGGSFASIDPCPTTRPDGHPVLAGLVQVTVSTASGDLHFFGTVGQTGSWTVNNVYTGSAIQDLSATVIADCLDATWPENVVAEYARHPFALNP
jgi:hypothetical protein